LTKRGPTGLTDKRLVNLAMEPGFAKQSTIGLTDRARSI
jgi:hypothetical protein